MFVQTNRTQVFGYRLTASGNGADPKKVTAILDMPAPTTVPLLRQVMGMVHFLGSCLPDPHSVTRPLNDLLKDYTVWAWRPAQDEAFVNTMLVASTPILAYYDETKSTCVSADASSYGIGGVLTVGEQ